jgi:LytR cell envelope-related transcriptional attenuator
MAVSSTRRPLPALVFLLVLSVLTAIVWWRVLHRPDASSSAASPPSTAAPLTCTPGSRAVRLPAPNTVLVVVLNGANRDQLATQVTAQLKARGFRTGTPGNAPSILSGTAEIQFSTASRAGATLLSYYIPGARLVPGNATGSAVNLVLGTGFKALAAQATVNNAVAKANKPC